MSVESLHRVARGNLTGKSKCWIPKEWGRHTCNNKARWYVFPAGPGSLDSTQYSNLCANTCDDHIVKAIEKSEKHRQQKKK